MSSDAQYLMTPMSSFRDRLVATLRAVESILDVPGVLVAAHSCRICCIAPERVAALRTARRLAIRLDAELLAAPVLALVPFPSGYESAER